MSSDRRNASTLMGAMIILAGIALVVMSVALTKETGGKGMETETLIYYGLENLIMAILGGMFISGGASYLILNRPGEVRDAISPIAGVKEEYLPASDDQGSVHMTGRGEARPANSDLVLRLLEGDERIMYRTILDGGGEVLQKDLMEKAKMSNAKVTRMLDRLEGKGLIIRERHGMTNKVRIDEAK